MNAERSKPILVTGAAGQVGAWGGPSPGLLLDRGLPVRALVRREDERAAPAGRRAEVVVGDLLTRRRVPAASAASPAVYFGMSVSPDTWRRP
jgi:uncharacterized protein YbjT (DUF2867 family)